VTRAAFGQRRKMLRSSLRGLGPDPAGLLAAAGVDGSRRAEELTLAEFRKLAEMHLASGSAEAVRPARDEASGPDPHR
jgi:16S rRNA (adenine1518-N6/adenine1519-N6)-dimethyltransferase